MYPVEELEKMPQNEVKKQNDSENEAEDERYTQEKGQEERYTNTQANEEGVIRFSKYEKYRLSSVIRL